MGLLEKIFTAPGRAYRWLYQDEKRLRRSQARGQASEGEPDANVEDDEMQRRFADYNVWEEIDDIRANFLIGNWALRKIRGIGTDRFHRDREALAKEKAEAEGREYKSKLQLDLEAVARKREEKERRKAEKRRQKEERKRKA